MQVTHEQQHALLARAHAYQNKDLSIAVIAWHALDKVLVRVGMTASLHCGPVHQPGACITYFSMTWATTGQKCWQRQCKLQHSHTSTCKQSSAETRRKESAETSSSGVGGVKKHRLLKELSCLEHRDALA